MGVFSFHLVYRKAKRIPPTRPVSLTRVLSGLLGTRAVRLSEDVLGARCKFVGLVLSGPVHQLGGLAATIRDGQHFDQTRARAEGEFRG
jgi:hypothetical protein